MPPQQRSAFLALLNPANAAQSIHQLEQQLELSESQQAQLSELLTSYQKRQQSAQKMQQRVRLELNQLLPSAEDYTEHSAQLIIQLGHVYEDSLQQQSLLRQQVYLALSAAQQQQLLQLETNFSPAQMGPPPGFPSNQKPEQTLAGAPR